jgi:flagella basal body P-ring formation protein FlgA
MVVAAMASLPAAAAGEDAVLHLYLPRTRFVEATSLTLGTIAVLRSDDEALRRKAESVALGRAPWSGEVITIDRRTIRGRLAAAGVTPERTRITGAKEVSVRRNEKVVAAERLVEAAKATLKKKHPPEEGTVWQLVRMPRDLTYPAAASVTLETSVGEKTERSVVMIVAARSGTRQVAARPVLFRLAYSGKRAVVVEDVPAGATITPKNVRIEIVAEPRPSRRPWQSPYGMIALRPLARGTALGSGMVRPARAETVVRRNDTIVMKIEGPGFLISTKVQALQDGRAGEQIRVQNIRTKKVVIGRVMWDGSVEPLIDER